MFTFFAQDYFALSIAMIVDAQTVPGPSSRHNRSRNRRAAARFPDTTTFEAFLSNLFTMASVSHVEAISLLIYLDRGLPTILQFLGIKTYERIVLGALIAIRMVNSIRTYT
jgi:hypothetical protein